MHYIYILQSQKDKALYIGYSNDLRKRLKMHNSGKVFSTKPRIPFVLIYYEAYQNKNDAFEREHFFKTGWGKNYIKRILKHYFDVQKFGKD